MQNNEKMRKVALDADKCSVHHYDLNHPRRERRFYMSIYLIICIGVEHAHPYALIRSIYDIETGHRSQQPET